MWECFNVPDSISGDEQEVVDPGELGHMLVAQSLLDFDLSLLPPSSVSVSKPGAASGVEAETVYGSCDSVQLRISDLEERFGVIQFAFWRVTSSSTISAIVSLYRETSNLAVSEADFCVVRPLNRRKGGVLFRVRFLVLKRRILASHAALRARGFHIDFI